MSLHAVILAGGSGTRFWPLSREQAPKQLLSVFGNDSLIVGTLERAKEVIGEDGHIHIVVSESLFDELRNHLLSHKEWRSASINYIREPAARNTAPALALAAAMIAHQDPDATIIMLPSDHLCEQGVCWQTTIAEAVDAAADGSLVTIGLRPTRPDTGFGYISACHPERTSGACAVERFIEKPDRETAERFMQEGGYYWNSGMLVARADAVLEQLLEVQRLHPEASAARGNDALVSVARALADDPTDMDALRQFKELPKEPFDKAALELSPCVKVVPTSFAWSDVGSLLALEALAEPNERGTRVIGQGIDVDSVGTLNYSSKRLVTTLGLRDVLVVDTEDATLVAARDRAQDVRLIVGELQRRGCPETSQTQTSRRPWGSWTMLTRGIGYHVKEIVVNAGASLSLQRHHQRSEHWIVIEGEATVGIDGIEQVMSAGQSVFIPCDALHRLANEGDSPLRIVEVAAGAYLGEDDIERFDDNYGR